MVVTTSIANFTLRNATPADIPLILSFIKELAEYEKLSSEVIATEEILAESLFGEHSSSAEVVIGYYKNKPIAFALFFHNFSRAFYSSQAMQMNVPRPIYFGVL